MFKISNRFRWAFCQLEVLRDCLPPSVRRTLDELPESLDETYERILKEIKKPNRDHARRLLSCLIVAIRPLQVEELAEVFAVDFDDEEGIPRLNPNWRWEDQEQALLTSCSSLIAIVESYPSRVVQFSHFSVKEYLTSTRLATSSADLLRYHIAPEPAHTILAQACLSIFFRSGDQPHEQNGDRNNSPLTEYAVQHWIAHARYENVSSCIRKAMEYLFDPDKPYFAAWLQMHDVDTGPPHSSTFYLFTLNKSNAVPLYYAALCGLQDLVERLILKYPQHVNASGGYYVRPIVAALAGEHFQTARILHGNGAHVDVRGHIKATPLHSAAYFHRVQVIRVLLECKADTNARNSLGETPLHYASRGPWSAKSAPNEVIQLLLAHGADINVHDSDHSTPLHIAVEEREFEAVRALLEHGARVHTKDKWGRTPLQLASSNGYLDIIKLLSEYGAD
jgi:Ankyrin repeats (3 copies)/Ankyrin repeats (many copies)